MSGRVVLTLEIAIRNQLRLAQWRERWFLQNGTHLFPAHPYKNLRNEEDRRRYLHIEYERYVARRWIHNARRVVRLASSRVAGARVVDVKKEQRK